MPGTRRIFAGVSGSPGSVHALRQAAQLAHHHDALLIPVLAWLPPDSRRLPWPELRQIWHDDAWQRLWDTLDATFGGLPDGIATEPAVLRGNPPQGADRCGPPGRRRAGHRRRAARPPAADVGQPGQPLLPGPRPLPGAGHPSPCLAQQAGHGLRGWAFRHRWARAAAQPA
jgi:hypothetical protein